MSTIKKVNLRQSYRYYQRNAENPVSVKAYIHIVLGFLRFMMQKVFAGNDVRLPADLGVIGVRGRKVNPQIGEDGNIKNLAPDWGATKKLWASNPKAKEEKQLVYCFNEHTNGLRYKIVWFRRNVKFRNRSVYTLKFSRANKRTVSKLAKQGQEYLESH